MLKSTERAHTNGQGHLAQQHHVTRSGLATAARLATTLLARGKSVVFVVKDNEELAKARALLTLFTPDLSADESGFARTRWELPWISLPSLEPQSHNLGQAQLGGQADTVAARMASLYALSLKHNPCGVILTVDNFLPKLPPVNLFDTHDLRLSIGNDMAPELILDQAIDWGFERVPMVSRPGEIAVRGDIVDIFLVGYERPIRIEFFGDTIEDIRLFDAGNQRSLQSIPEFVLVPVRPVILTKEWRDKADARWKRLFNKGFLTSDQLAGLRRTVERRGDGLYVGAFYEAASILEEWLPRKATWIMTGQQDIRDALTSAAHNWTTVFEKQDDECVLRQPPSMVVRDAASAQSVLDAASAVYFEPLLMGIETSGDHESALPERRLHSFTDLFPLPEAQERPWQTLVTGLRELGDKYKRIVLTFGNARSRAKFLKLGEQDGLMPSLRYDPEGKGLMAVVSPFRSGVDLAWDGTLVIGEEVLQPRNERSRRVPTGAFKGLDRYDGLHAGDLLVHRDYGVARFGGLHHLDLGGVANDFLLLEYAADDKLYLPVDRLSLVQRYKGGDEARPILDKLGGGAWQASKDKARKAIEKIAADLVEMYAYRKVAKGFQYGPVGELYREFEASFGFEETPDQAKAIQDVLDDMEKSTPMDRLVCGDVGFGKTEVALRASFRAASEGRQVALLCPTTVLAEQHYQTFRSRLAGFPINVGMVSRFVSRQKQKEILEAAARGHIDILIGTHRLLSDDVRMPQLGLLILDEEQRFGVRHKEKMKQFKRNVDALTLTATPIPRTLQLSMSGVRELSVIETAPPERKPVATALIERKDEVLKEVLERELAREGQVFWVHNRVQGLERVCEYVRKLAPQARIGMAHGQMSEKALEETMHQFWHGELDVLVCTAIVESGLDFPRANTLVVDQAQMFGLGQLYQLRGRVGRSDRQAYAVFVVSDLGTLPELARERMRIILELDYLGAGFQVAMEDLRLRGAGNILGEVQSGHMTRVGIELFLEMLEEAVTRLKGEPVREETQTELNIAIAAHIPDEYVADPSDRLRLYKSLSSAEDAQAQQDIELEMRDRYGAFPQELENFLALLVFKRFLCRMQVQRADIYNDRVKLTWGGEQDAVDLMTITSYVMKHSDSARLLPPGILELRQDATLSPSQRFDAARSIVEGFALKVEEGKAVPAELPTASHGQGLALSHAAATVTTTTQAPTMGKTVTAPSELAGRARAIAHRTSAKAVVVNRNKSRGR
ncbi:MAG: transcription-repair coupling factor [Pseudomonadota bacterium]